MFDSARSVRRSRKRERTPIRLLSRKMPRRTFAAACLAVLAAPLVAQANPAIGRTQQEAIDAIPFQQLTPAAQQKLWQVVSRPSLYRQMPTTLIESDPEMYLFLLRHPEVIVNMWELLGITKVSIDRTGDFEFKASDGAGTASNVELIYGDRDTHVIYAEGTYQGPLFKRNIAGRCVLVLQSAYAQSMDQSTYVTNRMDVFLQIDDAGTELIAKTLHPLVGGTADKNFVESLKFVAQVTKAAEEKPERVQLLCQRLTKITPRVRDDFSRIATLVASRSAARAGLQTMPDPPGPETPVSTARPQSASYSIDDHD